MKASLHNHTLTQQQIGKIVKSVYFQYVHDLSCTEDANSFVFNRHRRHFEHIGYTKYSYYLQSSVPFINSAMKDTLMMIVARVSGNYPKWYYPLLALQQLTEAKIAYYEALHHYTLHDGTVSMEALAMVKNTYTQSKVDHDDAVKTAKKGK